MTRSKGIGVREAFVSERALCDVLAAAVRELGWRWYPETSGWDALVALPDGMQIGVQAKLTPNVKVLAQALPDLTARGWPVRQKPSPADVPGPDVRAVLVPDCDGVFRGLADHLGLLVLRGGVLRGDDRESFWYDRAWPDMGAAHLGGAQYLERVVARAPRFPYSRREWVPPFEPDGPAGVPSPSGVTPWRVSAAKLCAEIRAGLTPTAKQLEERGMSLSRWRTWLDPVEGTKPRRYALRDGTYLPDVSFPDVALGLGLPPPPDRWTGARREAQYEPTWSAAYVAAQRAKNEKRDALIASADADFAARGA